jgi:hypothetical protein
MGGGAYSDHDYHTRQQSRRSQGIDDFHYSQTNSTIHPSLDPKRIKSKPFHKLESRDSAEHPKSNAVVVTFDVTGSNIENARTVQKKLPLLMGLLGKYLEDVQVAVAANDDIISVGNNAVQISEFESDIRIDESIRSLLLTAQGGCNDGESYELMLYGIARKTILDCFEKRGRKGYLFIYADEPMRLRVHKKDVHTIYGEHIEDDIPFQDIVNELHRQYHVCVLWPANSQYEHSREQYKHIFGKEHVFTLESPETICEFIGAVIGINEAKVSANSAVSDLVAMGTSQKVAAQLVHTVVASAPQLTAGD